MYEIRQVRMDDGEVLYLLADRKTGLPDSYVIKNKLRGIGVGMTILAESR